MAGKASTFAVLTLILTLNSHAQLGTWQELATASSIPARTVASGVWTGSEFIIWGGEGPGISYKNGGRFSPSLNQWTAIDAGGILVNRSGHSSIWTGTLMIIWGGFNGAFLSDGASYEPLDDIWNPIPDSGLNGRLDHVVAWTDTEMIIWGGFDGAQYRSDGAAYNPAAAAWRLLPQQDAPTPRSTCASVWTGKDLIIWGGGSFGVPTATGALYNPANNAWQPMSTSGAPPGSYWTTAVWTGSEMLVWGGRGLSSSLSTGGVYNPATDTWRTISTVNAPTARDRHVTVWTGSRMIVWGGYSTLSGYQKNGGAYDPIADTWTPLANAVAPEARTHSTAVWTGRSMLVFGGHNGSYDRTAWSLSLDALNDGIPAAWREEHFGPGYLTDPRVAADADPDGDGSTNLQEYIAGSNPLDKLSGFRVGIRVSPTITWQSVPGEIYRILRKEHLSDPEWIVVAPAVFTIGEQHTFVDQNATNANGFYVVEPIQRAP